MRRGGHLCSFRFHWPSSWAFGGFPPACRDKEAPHVACCDLALRTDRDDTCFGRHDFRERTISDLPRAVGRSVAHPADDAAGLDDRGGDAVRSIHCIGRLRGTVLRRASAGRTPSCPGADETAPRGAQGQAAAPPDRVPSLRHAPDPSLGSAADRLHDDALRGCARRAAWYPPLRAPTAQSAATDLLARERAETGDRRAVRR